MADRPVARLVGELGFNIDAKSLDAFFRKLGQAEQRMKEFGRLAGQNFKVKVDLDTTSLAKQIAAANKQLGQKLGINGQVGNKTTERAAAQQLRLEKLTAQARRETFKAELAQSKLSFANRKEDVALGTAQVRQQQQLAVLAAKQAQASIVDSKARLGAARVEDFLAQAKVKQARLETMLTTARSKSAIAATQEARQQTALQRAQLALAGSKEAERRRDVAHQQRQQDRRDRLVRAEQGQERQRERFRFSAERHTAWQARQVELAERKAAASQGGFGLSGMMGALGRSGIPLVGLAAGGLGYGVQQLLSAAGQRVEARQQGVVDSEQYRNLFANASNMDKGMSGVIEKNFVDSSQKYGTEISFDTAKNYTTFIQKQRSLGRTLNQATALYDTQTAAFRGASMTADEMFRADKQLTQIRARGYAQGEDLGTFGEAAPILRQYVDKAFAERTGFKGTPDELQAKVNASTETRSLKAVDFNRALELYKAQNQESIDRGINSVAALQQRAANDQFLQAINVNNDAETAAAVRENIEAHRQLTEAMLPLNLVARQFDTALTEATAGLVRFAASALKYTPDEDPSSGKGAAMAAAGPEGVIGSWSPIRAPTDEESYTYQSKDPIGKFWSYLFGADTRTQRAKDSVLGVNPFNPNEFSTGNELAPTQTSAYSFDLKKLSGFVSDEQKRQTAMIQGPTQNTNNVTVGPATYNLSFPNINTLDKGAVEEVVREVGGRIQQEREAAWRAQQSADKTPR